MCYIDFFGWLFFLLETSVRWVFLGIWVIVIIALFAEYGHVLGNIFGFVYCTIVVHLGLGGICSLIAACSALFDNGDLWEFIKSLFSSRVMFLMAYEMIKFALYCFEYI